ncbi:hypothetical protein Gogos_017908, partial [Gossypium gossypioides]|nr:hypothetical protein [Gossypium gossypioides]
ENLLPPSLIVSITLARDLLGFCIKHIRRLYFWVLRLVENVKKLMLEAKLSKEMCMSPTVHPSDCRSEEAPINDDVNVGKAETSSTTVTVAIPIADSSAPIALDKGMSSLSTLTIGQKQNPNPETSAPW